MNNIEKLKEDILQTYQEEILGIHEFHLWSLMHGQIVANLHVTFKNTEVHMYNTIFNSDESEPQSKKNRGCLSLTSNMGNQFSAIWAALKKLPKKSQF